MRLDFLERTAGLQAQPRPRAQAPAARFIKLWRQPSPLRAAALGFAAGALFWHLVGFWTFMSHIMFSSPEVSSSASATGKALASTAGNSSAHIETGSLQRLEKLTSRKVESECTAVARDPATGAARQSTCQKLTHPFELKTGTDRQDRIVPPKNANPKLPALALDQTLPLQWPPDATAR